jgi:hypothetical protein
MGDSARDVAALLTFLALGHRRMTPGLATLRRSVY